MLNIDLHTHTIASGHAFHTINEMAAEAARRGVEMLGITDHGPAYPGSAPLSYFMSGKRLPEEINGIRVIFGVEANILDKFGKLDLLGKALERLDIVIAGLHMDCGYIDLGRRGNTQAIINTIKNPIVKIISHPYNVSNGFDVDIEDIAKAACKYNTLLEINSSYFFPKKSQPEKVYDRIKRMVAILKKSKKKIIINSDAHSAYEIGRDEEVKEKFSYLGLSDNDMLNNDVKAVRKYFNFN